MLIFIIGITESIVKSSIGQGWIQCIVDSVVSYLSDMAAHSVFIHVVNSLDSFFVFPNHASDFLFQTSNGLFLFSALHFSNANVRRKIKEGNFLSFLFLRVVSSWLCCFRLPFFLLPLSFTKKSITSFAFCFFFFNFCSVLDCIFIYYFLVKAFQYTLFVPHMQFCHFSYSINFLVPFLFLKAQPWYSFFSLICLLIFFDLLLKLKILTFSWSDNIFFCQKSGEAEKKFYILPLFLLIILSTSCQISFPPCWVACWILFSGTISI